MPLSDIVSITKGETLCNIYVRYSAALSCVAGVYILSPLEEGSRDPVQNHGFIVSYLNSGQMTRITSYSLRNSADLQDDDLVNVVPNHASTNLQPSSPPGRGSNALSRLLSNASVKSNHNPLSFVAFKALPIDPARSRRGTGSFDEYADDLAGATTCKEAVDVIVDAIRRAREDVGDADGLSIMESDIVRYVSDSAVIIIYCLTFANCYSLAEAQRMTTVYAKMEYGLKRLLWLGG